MKRQRSKPHSFEDRLAAEKKRLEAKAALLREGDEREALLGKIAQIDTACHLNELLRPPRPRPSDQDPSRKYWPTMTPHRRRRTDGNPGSYPLRRRRSCAKRLVDGHAVELWQQAGKMERFESEEQAHRPSGTLQRPRCFGFRRIFPWD
jgi:hypothetical protein